MEVKEYTPTELAGLNVWWQAYAIAHGNRVVVGRNDVYGRWLGVYKWLYLRRGEARSPMQLFESGQDFLRSTYLDYADPKSNTGFGPWLIAQASSDSVFQSPEQIRLKAQADETGSPLNMLRPIRVYDNVALAATVNTEDEALAYILAHFKAPPRHAIRPHYWSVKSWDGKTQRDISPAFFQAHPIP
jgi:hypothetical protein